MRYKVTRKIGLLLLPSELLRVKYMRLYSVSPAEIYLRGIYVCVGIYIHSIFYIISSLSRQSVSMIPFIRSPIYKFEWSVLGSTVWLDSHQSFTETCVEGTIYLVSLLLHKILNVPSPMSLSTAMKNICHQIHLCIQYLSSTFISQETISAKLLTYGFLTIDTSLLEILIFLNLLNNQAFNYTNWCSWF